MKIKKAIFAAVALMMAITSSCGGGNAEAPSITEAPTASNDNYAAAMAQLAEVLKTTPKPTNENDSLSYYLGFCEGMYYQETLTDIPAETRSKIDKEDYKLGVYSVLASDTTSASYADGVKAGVKLSRRIAEIESMGHPINRQLLVSTIVESLNNAPADEATLAEAAQISNELMMRKQ